MDTPLVIALVIELISVVTICTRIQVDNTDGKAWVVAACGICNLIIIGGVIIYYLRDVYPVIHGR